MDKLKIYISMDDTTAELLVQMGDHAQKLRPITVTGPDIGETWCEAMKVAREESEKLIGKEITWTLKTPFGPIPLNRILWNRPMTSTGILQEVAKVRARAGEPQTTEGASNTSANIRHIPNYDAKCAAQFPCACRGDGTGCPRKSETEGSLCAYCDYHGCKKPETLTVQVVSNLAHGFEAELARKVACPVCHSVDECLSIDPPARPTGQHLAQRFALAVRQVNLVPCPTCKQESEGHCVELHSESGYKVAGRPHVDRVSAWLERLGPTSQNVKCPTCGAEVGYPCSRAGHPTVPTWTPHRTRVAASKRVKESQENIARALAVDCPICKVPAGAVCVNAADRKTPLDSPHAGRFLATAFIPAATFAVQTPTGTNVIQNGERIDPASVACSYCAANPGDPCVFPNRETMGAFHDARMLAAGLKP